ncbi:hypothetical protein CASFOL_015150 [Castilleja foliolosa]|uniref:CASP-like protein n=1 Tax=Castilleja foliolosa TaxID=1961234 RepID=A0ABD3DDS8_9LAMI
MAGNVQTLHDAQSHRNAFLTCVVVNCIGCIYNLLVLCIPEGSQLWKTVIVFDVIVNLLVGASIGAGWQTYAQINAVNIGTRCSTCDKLPYFCSKVLGALITSSFGFSISILLTIYILHVSVDPFLVGN